MATLVACGLLACGPLACGKTTRNSTEPELDDASLTSTTAGGETPRQPDEPPPDDPDPPPDDCPPLDEDLFRNVVGTHILAAEYGATVVDGLGDTEVEFTVTPTPMGTQVPCSDETEIPAVFRLVTSDHVFDASTSAVLMYNRDGGSVELRTELTGTRPWSQVSFSPSRQGSPQLGPPTLEWSEKQSAEFFAVFMPPGEYYEAEYSGTFDALSWPADCWDEPDIWRTSHLRIETALEERYALLERQLPLALNWRGGDAAELDLSVTPKGPVCGDRGEQPVLIAASSSDGHVDAVWHAQATRADTTWLTLDAVVSDRVALEERLGILLDLAGDYDAYGLRFSLRWRNDSPIGMLQVLGIDREPCGDTDTCAEATEIAVATIGKLGSTVSSEVLSRDLTGDSGVCPGATLVVAGVGRPLLSGVVENDTSLNAAAVDQCNGGAPRLVFDWEAPHTGKFRFDTHGSDYDTVLTLRSLRSDGQCTSLTGDACNDDSGGRLTSELTTTVDHQRVSVEIASYGGRVQPASDAATYQLNITEVE